MLPLVFFSTASRTAKQSGKEKRPLSIFQIETVDKMANHEFPGKIVFSFGDWGGGVERRGLFCLTENFLLNGLGQTTTPETTFPTLFEKIIVAMAENCE